MSSKDMRRFVAACEEKGLVYDPYHKHPRVTDPQTGRFVSISRSPSCPYAHRNMARDVKKYLGIEIAIR